MIFEKVDLPFHQLLPFCDAENALKFVLGLRYARQYLHKARKENFNFNPKVPNQSLTLIAPGSESSSMMPLTRLIISVFVKAVII